MDCMISQGIDRVKVHYYAHSRYDSQFTEVLGATSMKVTRKNPGDVAPPIGAYTHLSIVPSGAELLVLSGQVGTDADGNLPSDAEGQMCSALNNVLRILNGEGVSAEGIIKVNIWLTEPIKRDRFLEIWSQFHGGTPPSTTMAYVTALAQPALKVEVEVWAARW
jgi:ribosomal-protein-alanine N-acetyltransferase